MTIYFDTVNIQLQRQFLLFFCFFSVQECLTPSPAVVRGRESVREGGGRREVVRYVELVMEGRERGRGGEREVERVREQLEMSQKTNNELSQKYIAASEKVSGYITNVSL